MNITVLEWISANRPDALDAFFLAVTKLGSEYLPIILIAVVFWCLERRYSDRVLLLILFSLLTNQLLKLIFVVKRPWLKSDKVKPVEKALPDATGYSFPSGHTTNATACAEGISMLSVPKWIKYTGWALALLVAASRLYLCVHTPADVFFGFLITIAILFAVKKLCAAMDKKPSLDLAVIAGSVFLTVLIVALAFIRPENGTNTRTDVIKMSGACMGGLVGWFMCRRFIPYTPVKDFKHALYRVIPGLIIIFLLLEGTKPLFNALLGEVAGGCARYLTATLTAFGLWPWIFTKVKL